MKTSLFLQFLVFLFAACEKETINPMDAGSSKSLLTIIDDDCGLTECEIAIAETKAANQALADATCDTIWQEIVCCHDGLKAYALVYTAPRCLSSKDFLSDTEVE